MSGVGTVLAGCPRTRDNARPARNMQTMIIDAHTHIFPEEVLANPERFGDLDPAFGMMHAGGARMVSPAELLEEMDRHGIDKALLTGFPWRAPELCRLNNDFIMEVMRTYPGRFLGLAVVNPSTSRGSGPGETLAEAMRCLEAGMHGIGELHLEMQGFSLHEREVIEPLCDVAMQYDRPLMIHVNEPVGHNYPGKEQVALSSIYSLICDYPEMKLILPHWGGGFFLYELMPEVAQAASKVFYDSAASPFLYDSRIHSVAENCAGARKLLFGTDFPLIPYQRCLDDVYAGGMSDAGIAAFLGGNARRLFRIE